ncbi:pilus assembly protein [Agarilytica rhodophyticola]|uniref:pilus assembly protein n=1 Tax=Agarilytica rhodophyticola TaxID=1737490 RepID=UPI000B34642B|nr:PilC/PilY family type IV pilus protein [Agarilytica rhodophyticola]
MAIFSHFNQLKIDMNVKQYIERCFCLVLLSVSFSVMNPAYAQVAEDYSILPPTVVDSTTPLVMLVMSRDNQLWHKAYNDYSDLDGDGVLDTTYKDDFEYYGYFHSDFCYSYSGPGQRFSPTSRVRAGSHQCSNAWSGNFLNWLTTTRIDVVRKVLYGGYRLIDNNSATVLQRAFIPADNHAFVKVVRNTDITGDISDYTPIRGQSELSFCNVTDAQAGGPTFSADINLNITPPRLKVAVGNEFAWAGSERNQCQYEDEGGRAEFSARRPPFGSISGIPRDSELVVRVEVCVDGFDATDDQACQEYRDQSTGDVNEKPFGLLQTYGETGTYKFGLMTGSYSNNEDGGVLRKNVTFMGGLDANPSDLEIDSRTGIFINQSGASEGIIRTLNLLRIQGWEYNSTTYLDCNRPGISELEFLTSGSSERECKDWGNPLSEIYLEALRYIGAASPTPAFRADNPDVLTGLNTATWADPYDADAPCSQCSVIVLSTGLNNFDGDELGSASSLPGFSAARMRLETDRVGVAEGLNSGTYIVGQSPGGGGTADECDAKSISRFSGVSGPCPEVPSLNGSYNIAGAALYANQNDLRTDLEGDQTVSTYTVALAESLPSFNLPQGSANPITIVPTCRSHPWPAAAPPPGDNDWGECSLVDLTVVEQNANYGRFVVAWEDSTWGNDYDMDSYAVIEYCVASGNQTTVRNACPDLGYNDQNPNYHNRRPRGSSYNYRVHQRQPQWQSAAPGQVQIRMSVAGAATSFAMRLGYTVSGSNGQDGSYVNEVLRYGNYNFNGVLRAIPGANTAGLANNRVIWSENVRVFSGDSSSSGPKLLQNPLWYAAKYGAFEDVNDDGLPDTTPEWDRLDIEGNEVVDGSGNVIGDGIPDSFFPVRNPARLPQALTTIFANLNSRISSGSAAAVNAQTGSGEGAIYQALYSPRLEDSNSNSITWFGTVNGLFLDDRGRIREDGDQDGILTNSDRILELNFDEAAGETLVQAITVNGDGSTGTNDGAPFALTSSDYRPIWSAQEQLRSLATYTDNRSSYGSSAGNGRYIFTSFDRDGDGQVIGPVFADANPGSTATVDGAHPFVSSNFGISGNTGNDTRLLGLSNTATQIQIDNLINYIRGEEGIPGTRSRTLNSEANLLGDIVNSTPTVVGAPSEAYDVIFNDDTYANYIAQYAGRRNVLYVGANDGMLHAFNAGFFNPQVSPGGDIAFQTTGGAGTTPHPLGSELWAYIPYNLLPHLQWLTAPNYPHVYYVDGPVKSYDVNIFTPDAVHPDGWGTIIVASMRFGGGDYSIDHDNNASTPDITTRSAYIVMDVTDPESPPELLAEITDEDLGFSTAVPTIIKYRQPRASGSYVGTGENAWYLAFGSGPAGNDPASRLSALNLAVSNKSAKVYLFDLVNRTSGTPLQKIELTDGAGPEINSFTGGFETADWDIDYQDDALYFGLIGGTPAVPTGKLKRGRVASASGSNISLNFSNLYNDTNRAFSATPRTFRDEEGDFWVFAGTGRFFVPQDNVSRQTQYYFGIKEPKDANGNPRLDVTVNSNDLVDTTGVDVFEDGQVFGDGGSTVTLSAGGASEAVAIFQDVLDFVADHGGWQFEFRSPGAARHTPGSGDLMRNTTQSALAGTSLIITTYNATGEFCDSEGEGFLFAPHLGAGIPAPFAPVDIDPTDRIPALEAGDPPVARVLQGITLGDGPPSAPEVIQPQKKDGPAGPCQGYQVITQSSTADINKTQIACQGLPAGRRGWRELPVN